MSTATPGTVAEMRRGPAPGRRRRAWPAPVALAVLSIVPVTAGVLRLVQLAGGPALIPADPRFPDFPVALVLHIAAAVIFAVAGILQFVPRIRRRHRTWHRRAGRVLVGAGLVVAGSALWLTLLYPAKPGMGDLVFLVRLLAGAGMAAALVLGLAAIRRRDIRAHRAWMIRAYALGLGAGTQVVTEGLAGGMFGDGVLVGDLAMAAGWAINLAVAEWIVRREPRPAKAAARVKAVAPA